MRAEDKLNALCDYVSVNVSQWVESIPEYEGKDYEGWKAAPGGIPRLGFGTGQAQYGLA